MITKLLLRTLHPLPEAYYDTGLTNNDGWETIGGSQAMVQASDYWYFYFK